jgi:hypothetical protein
MNFPGGTWMWRAGLKGDIAIIHRKESGDMALLTHIITADEDEIEDVGASMEPLEQWSGIQAVDIDTAKLATLHCLLTDDGFEDALCAYEPVYAVEEGALVLRIPDEVMAKLAQLDEQALERVAEELAASEEFEMGNRTSEEVEAIVFDLADLARLAESQDQVMLVWLYPEN